MRLHRLEITAFGPFTDTVRVDFDRLSDAGLFLFTGPTGAGKTSVLDAVCFALYGDVPGDRAAAKRLRSDHAAPGARPRVELEATLAGRRFRLIRSPSWERPKKRGTGTTTEQASVVVGERVDGEWITHSTRLDEAGHLVGELLGMTLTQFTQVAMLPQGRFQAFLRARSEVRQELLQRLFRTSRFADMERWLHEHRVGLRRESEEAHKVLAGVVSRVLEAGGATLPDSWDPADLTVPAADGSLEKWSDRLLDVARSSDQEAQATRAAADQAERAAREALERARQLATRRARAVAAHDERARLRLQEPEIEESTSRLAAARRAAGVLPLSRMADRARRAHDAASAAVTAQERPVTETDLEQIGEQLSVTKALLPREQRLASLRTEIAEATEQLAEDRRVLSTAQEESSVLPSQIDELRAEIESAQEAAATVESVSAQLDAVRSVDELTPELAALRADHEAAREQVHTAREHLLDVRQARLNHMAAELAGSLAAGDDCPVCGSCDHPAKAPAVAGSPDAAAERAAQRGLDDANAAEHALGLSVREIHTRLDLAEQRAGLADPVALGSRLGEARSAADRLPRLRARLSETEERRSALGPVLTELGVSVAARQEHLRALESERTEHHRVVTDHLDGSGHDSLTDLVSALETRLTTCRDQLAAIERADRTRAALDEATATLEAASTSAGFSTSAEALAGALTADETERLESWVRAHERSVAVAESVLAEQGTEDLLASAAPAIDELSQAHSAALADSNHAAATARGAAERAQRLDALHDDLIEALARWAPLQSDLLLAESVSQFVEGKHPDNHHRMRLSAYVVAYRLTQVVAAANERLARMSDQRYSLEHSVHRGVRENRGGLSLLVRDDWTGEARDPATLSGGETFVVSLALALGLADVITQEAGGAELDTLFVDEGFGSLDADTLDDVMDTLDALRDGGRVVGVVSHVAEMRDRIPAQLTVGKARTGSTLRVRGA